MKPTYLCHDTRDDRRELHTLLCRLPPAARVRYLEWACTQAALHSSRAVAGRKASPVVGPDVYALRDRAATDDSADARLSLEVYFDVWHLAASYDFDLAAALAELVRRVRAHSDSSAAATARRLFRRA